MPNIWTSKDTDAPILTPNKGSFTRLLKAVLTQGYGEQAAAGWTLAFEDTYDDIVVFKNAGTGYFLRFAYAEAGKVYVTSYESMTDVNHGTNWSRNYLLDYYAEQTPLAWAIVGDNKSFYFYAKDTRRLWFFGDFPSFIAGELWNFAVSGRYLEGYGNFIDAIRKSTGEAGHVSLTLAGNPFGSNYFGGEGNLISYPYFGNVFISKPVLFEDAQPRGVLCGLTDFKHKKEDLIASLGIDGWVIKEVEGVNYIFFETCYGVVAIDLDNWWSIQ
jgi:hypothetical protein